jgi:hypothetical protein
MIRSRFGRLFSGLVVSLMLFVPLTATSGVATSYASQSTTVSGTVTVGTVATTWTQALGTSTLYGYTNPVTYVGGISGTGNSAGEWTLFASGKGQFSETVTVFGTVMGRTGAFIVQNVGTTNTDGSFQGRGVITEGIGGLAGLHGTITAQAINAVSSTYTGQVYFDSL